MKDNTPSRKAIRRQQGFTLVEMVVALFIVSVVMAVAIPNLQATGLRATQIGCEANQRMLRAALTEYYMTYHQFPQETTVALDIADLKAAGFLDSTPVCAGGGSYTFTPSADGQSITVACTVHGELGDK